MSFSATAVKVAALRRVLGSGADQFEVVIEQLALSPGEPGALTGPSGCGKSTILALLGLALRPEPGGSLLLQPPGEQPVEATTLWNRLDALGKFRGRVIGFVPQTGGLLPFLTLAENILLPLRMLGRPDPARVRTLAEALDILPALHRLPTDVSVGQRQRAAVARALIHAPALVLADEPTASVHPTQATAVLRLLIDAARSAGAALLVATHDIALADASGLATLPIRAEPGRSLLTHRVSPLPAPTQPA